MYPTVEFDVYCMPPRRKFPVAGWVIWIQAPLVRLWHEPNMLKPVGKLGDTWANRLGDEYVYRVNKFRELFGMAKPKISNDWQIAWVHVDLTPEQKSAYRAWDLEDVDVLNLWAGYLSAGYKVNTAHNPDNGQYSTSIICRTEGDANAGKGVTGYANDLINSMRIAFYKVSVILPPRWGDYAPPGGDDIG